MLLDSSWSTATLVIGDPATGTAVHPESCFVALYSFASDTSAAWCMAAAHMYRADRHRAPWTRTTFTRAHVLALASREAMSGACPRLVRWQPRLIKSGSSLARGLLA